jgi:hypothetical protein
VEDFCKNLYRWKEKNKNLLIDLMDREKKLKEINLKNPRISQKFKQSPVEELSKLLQRWQVVKILFSENSENSYCIWWPK